MVFDGTDRLIGRSVRVTIDDASPFTLYGRVLTDEVIGVNPGEPPVSTGGSPGGTRVVTGPARPDGRFSLPLA